MPADGGDITHGIVHAFVAEQLPLDAQLGHAAFFVVVHLEARLCVRDVEDSRSSGRRLWRWVGYYFRIGSMK